MGAMAEAFAAFAQPLLDQTDGSEEDLQRALSISQLCYNLALLPDDKRAELLREIRPTLDMDDNEFADFRRSILDPMIERHQVMFPRLHLRSSSVDQENGSPLRSPAGRASAGEPYPGTDRYAPCPCNSGEKYKFGCGSKKR
jgi:hypothetical protein